MERVVMARHVSAGGAKERLERGTLTRESIVQAAIRIMDETQESKLTFALLGRELGASPSAMYRHFTNREELIDALGDELIRISLDGYEPHERWEDSLWDLAERAWNTYSTYPVVARETYFRVTRGPNELVAVDAILQALDAAGLPQADAVMHYHVFVTIVLAQSADHAAKKLVLRDRHENSTVYWEQVYQPADPSAYPHYWAVREQLRQRDDHQVFKVQVDLFVDAVRRAVDQD